MPKAVLVPWVMAPWVHTIIQQQIPIYLWISYPAGAICLSVVTYHPASMGRACPVSSVLGLLFHTHIVLCLGHSTAHGSSWMDGNCSWSIRSGQCPSALCPWHLCSSGTALPRPPEPLKPRGGKYIWLLRNIRPWCLTNSKIYNTHKYKTHRLGMTWVQFVLNECHFLLHTAKASGSWHNVLHGDSSPCQGKAIPHFIHSGRAISS